MVSSRHALEGGGGVSDGLSWGAGGGGLLHGFAWTPITSAAGRDSDNTDPFSHGSGSWQAEAEVLTRGLPPCPRDTMHPLCGHVSSPYGEHRSY